MCYHSRDYMHIKASFIFLKTRYYVSVECFLLGSSLQLRARSQPQPSFLP